MLASNILALCKFCFITSVSTVSILGRDKGYMVKYTPSPESTKDCGQIHVYGTFWQTFLCKLWPIVEPIMQLLATGYCGWDQCKLWPIVEPIMQLHWLVWMGSMAAVAFLL